MADDRVQVPPGAEKFVTVRRWKPNGAAPTGEQTKKLRTRLASEVSPEAIRWAWRGWIAKGKLHILAGQPGDGKSTIAFEFAATVSCGGEWPDGSRANEGHVLIWSGEDTFADTIVPRLTRMGARLDRIHCIEGIDENGKKRPFDPARDIDAVRDEVERIGGVALVIIDPVALVASGRDSHKNTETRSALQPLVDLAGDLECAVVGIHHFTKGTSGRDPRDRITGSLAFGAAPRIILATGRRQNGDDGPERILVRAKSNIGPDGGGFGYALDIARLHEHPDIVVSRIRWEAPLEGSARDLLDEVEHLPNADDAKKKRAGEVRAWLEEFLRGGSRPQAEVEAEAAKRGFSLAQLKKAKRHLGVETARKNAGRRGSGGWWWTLQETPSEDELPF